MYCMAFISRYSTLFFFLFFSYSCFLLLDTFSQIMNWVSDLPSGYHSGLYGVKVICTSKSLNQCHCGWACEPTMTVNMYCLSIISVLIWIGSSMRKTGSLAHDLLESLEITGVTQFQKCKMVNHDDSFFLWERPNYRVTLCLLTF